MRLPMRMRLLLVSLLLVQSRLFPQAGQTGIREEVRTLETYPFGNPNPVPILTRDARLYPYHLFDDYSHTNEPRQWKVITLENDYIAVYILPEAGGKVWGAVDKSTGFEFIYRNEVMKFRNIALRGPWTSGGIEFNFGVIGHTPAGATPVDYTLQTTQDGGAVCTVGAMDLPSRTHWRVSILLPPDKACFETEAVWYNPTPFMHPCYNWMTGAAAARGDLRMFMPGNRYLQHSGRPHPWPKDSAGRDLSYYAENDFGSHKSYHVVGEDRDFFGGYYSGLDAGFGHWAEYREMPGQKLWLWALSRSGGIWENLLTDTDGQYIEFQAGRYLVQYSQGAHLNPVREGALEPATYDRWREVWFPVRGIGGLSDASPLGAMYVTEQDGRVTVRLNAFQESKGRVLLEMEGSDTRVSTFALQPLEVRSTTLNLPRTGDYRITVPALDLQYESNSARRGLVRPFETPADALEQMPEADRLMIEGNELLKARRIPGAKRIFESILEKRPYHVRANIALAELHSRSGLYKEGVSLINRALSINTYDSGANYVAGLLHRFSGDLLNARECFGWAARSHARRTAAFTQLAAIAMLQSNYKEALRMAEKALDADTRNIAALEMKAAACRLLGKQDEAYTALAKLEALDPLHHGARLERWLLDPSEPAGSAFISGLRSEYPDQTLLELAITYYSRGCREEAVRLLKMERGSIRNPLLDIWLAFLIAENDPDGSTALLEKAADMDPAFVFPYRRETLEPLQWTLIELPCWKFQYYLALNLWALTRTSEAARLLKHSGDEPDFAPFYTARAVLYRSPNLKSGFEDLRKALKENNNRRNLLQLISEYQRLAEWGEALRWTKQAYERYGDDFNTALLHARSLIHTGSYFKAIEILKRTIVLPSENAALSHRLWEWANLQHALDLMKNGSYTKAINVLKQGKEWPEHLGQGRPYNPDQRLFDYSLGLCYEKSGPQHQADACFRRVIDWSREESRGGSMFTALVYLALKKTGQVKKAEKLPLSFIGDTPWTRWNRAFIAGNDGMMKTEETEHKRQFSGVPFTIMKRIISISKSFRQEQ